MGSDDLFKKRKAKAVSDLERRKSRRASYDKVLIVCEGEKTEPNYLQGLIDFYKINSANVEVDCSCGSSPISVFRRAKELSELEKSKGDPFDRVYCVFDKDDHSNFDEAIECIINEVPKGTFYHVTSVPCFEYWIILHFYFTTRPYNSTPDKSCAQFLYEELVSIYPEYTKGSKDVFEKLIGQLEFAKLNAERSLQQSIENHTDNPMTLMHKLVDFLQKIKD